MFTQYLANSFSSPASIKNSISGAKTWINNHLGQSYAFDSLPVQALLKKITKESTHVPRPALPITDHELSIIVNFLHVNLSYHAAINPCILMSFYCMFRASNVTSPSLSQWGGTHTLRVSDITLNQKGMLVYIRSTKTSCPAKPHVIQVYPSDDFKLCPVKAWTRYVTLIRPPPYGPAFVLNNGRPLMAAPVVSAIREALASAGYTDLSRYSIHSFQRGSVQLAERLGVPRSDIMQHGLWTSQSGINYYTKTVSTSVAQALARGLAN